MKRNGPILFLLEFSMAIKDFSLKLSVERNLRGKNGN